MVNERPASLSNAGYLSSRKKIDQLLDTRFIQFAGMKTGSCVSHQRIYRATNPNIASNRKQAMKIPSEKRYFTAKKIAKHIKNKY